VVVPDTQLGIRISGTPPTNPTRTVYVSSHRVSINYLPTAK